MLGFSGAVLFRRDHSSQDVPRYFIKSKIISDLMAYIYPVQLGKTIQCDGWEHGLWVKQTWAQVPASPYINLNKWLSIWEPWCPAPPPTPACTVLASTSWFCHETCVRWYLNTTPESVSKRKIKWSRSVVSDSLGPYGPHGGPGSSIHGIFQARILEWGAISFSRRFSWPRDWTRVSHIVGRCFTAWATREV